MRITFILVALILFSCSNKEKIAHYKSRAIELYNKEDYFHAAGQIDSARRMDSADQELKFWDAKIKAKNKFYYPSIAMLYELIKRNYKTDSCYYVLAWNYYAAGVDQGNKSSTSDDGKKEYKEAIRALDSLLSRNAMYYNAYLLKYRTWHNMSEYTEAINLTNKALQLFGDSAELILYRGIEKISLSDYSGAMADLNRAIESKKLQTEQLSAAYRFRGMTHFAKEELQEALQDYTTAISIDSSDPYLYYNRAECYRKMKQKDLACADLRKSADMGLTTSYKDIKEYCEKPN